jgi:biopolymer transport protein ExbB/TolQ
MKSRRELIASFLVDLAKSIFIAFVVGHFVTPGIITWPILAASILFIITLVVSAWNLHPETVKDKELRLWKRF